MRDAVSLAAAIAAGILVIVYLLTVVLGRSISEPIQRLAEMARRIAERSDYSLRAPPSQGKEMVQLSADFNPMLDGISRRDTALVEARNQLQVRVIERTSELEIEIAEREPAQVAMQQSKEMFRTLSAAAPVGIAQLDAAGTEDWQDANPQPINQGSRCRALPCKGVRQEPLGTCEAFWASGDSDIQLGRG